MPIVSDPGPAVWPCYSYSSSRPHIGTSERTVFSTGLIFHVCGFFHSARLRVLRITLAVPVPGDCLQGPDQNSLPEFGHLNFRFLFFFFLLPFLPLFRPSFLPYVFRRRVRNCIFKRKMTCQTLERMRFFRRDDCCGDVCETGRLWIIMIMDIKSLQ